MNPKSGKAGSPVAPTDPENPVEADVADPGKAAKLKEKKGTTKPEKAHKPTEEDKEEKSWIEIELVDEEDQPVPGEKYKITLPDGSVAKGTLDENGFARVEGIEPGTCQITFPNLDKDAWEPA